MLAEHLGEDHAMRDFRKHTGWYMSGYPVGSEIRRRFSLIGSLTELDDVLAAMLDKVGADTTVVEGGERIKRGHTNGPIKVAIPEGWLDGQTRHDLDTDTSVPDDADVLALSGG
jgi:hypothetical protein